MAIEQLGDLISFILLLVSTGYCFWVFWQAAKVVEVEKIDLTDFISNQESLDSWVILWLEASVQDTGDFLPVLVQSVSNERRAQEAESLGTGFFVSLISLTLTATSVWLGNKINAHVVRNLNPCEGHFLLLALQ